MGTLSRWLSLLALIAGCRGAGPTGSDETGEGDVEDEYDPPVFVDPASGVLSLEHDQLVDEALRVADVVPGRTHVEIDGKSVGPLLSADSIGQLEPEALRLRLDGAMIRGSHTLRLVTAGTTAPQASSPVEIHISSNTVPKLSYELGATVIAEGRHAVATGANERGALLIVGASSPQSATLSLLLAKGANWDASDLRSLPLPGYVDLGDSGPAVAAGVMVDDDAPRVRVAWRVGSPGRRIDAVELEWGAGGNTVGDTLTVLDVEEVPDVEWASLGKPSFLAGNLVIEAHVPRDTEQVLPGDEALFAARWPSGDDGPAPAQRLVFGQLLDLDVVGPAIELGPGAPEQLGYRTDGRIPSVMRWDAGGPAPQTTGPSQATALPSVAGASLGVATIVGAFGSRTQVVVQADGELRVVLVETFLDAGRSANPNASLLPDEGPSGPPAATVAMGTPIFLVPYANAAAVIALLVDGDKTTVQVLQGLVCDEIAVPASTRGNEDGSMSFACVQGGKVRLGALFASKKN